MGENPTVKRPERGAFLLSGKERRNMAAETSFDYYYGDESNQFSFYRIPRQLVTGDRFKRQIGRASCRERVYHDE